MMFVKHSINAQILTKITICKSMLLTIIINHSIPAEVSVGPLPTVALSAILLTSAA